MPKSPFGSIRSPYFATIPLRGIILDDYRQAGGSGNAISAKHIAKLATELVTDNQLAGVLLHINSPGGLVTASESLYDSISQLRARVPVVTFVESLGASGGYMAALASEVIVASPTSLTGSVGVRLSLTNFYGLAKSHGVKEYLITTGSRKGAGSPLQKFTGADRAYFQELIDYSAKRFYAMVRENRLNISDKDFEQIASARVFTADRALALGVIDHIGKLPKAQEILRERAYARNPSLVGRSIAWKTKKAKTPSTFSRILQRFEQTHLSPLAEVQHMLGAGRYEHAELSGRAWAIHE